MSKGAHIIIYRVSAILLVIGMISGNKSIAATSFLIAGLVVGLAALAIFTKNDSLLKIFAPDIKVRNETGAKILLCLLTLVLFICAAIEIFDVL